MSVCARAAGLNMDYSVWIWRVGAAWCQESTWRNLWDQGMNEAETQRKQEVQGILHKVYCVLFLCTKSLNYFEYTFYKHFWHPMPMHHYECSFFLIKIRSFLGWCKQNDQELLNIPATVKMKCCSATDMLWEMHERDIPVHTVSDAAILERTRRAWKSLC